MITEKQTSIVCPKCGQRHSFAPVAHSFILKAADAIVHPFTFKRNTRSLICRSCQTSSLIYPVSSGIV
jgi:hypothetical protein